ncbi:AOFA-like protein, partial [Mya arenaria]
MSTKEVDVVIVGAGIAGLSCARYLLKKDETLNIVILEGKVGGRTLSVPLKTDDGTNTWDLGAHWVGRLVGELGLKTHEQCIQGRKFLQIGKDNSVRSYASDIPTLPLLDLLDLDRTMKKLDSLAREVDQNDPYSHKRGPEFDQMTLQTYLNNTCWRAESKELMCIAVRSTLGVEAHDISMLYFLTYVSSAGGLKQLTEATPYTAQEYTIQGGTQQISLKMAGALGNSVRLGEPVTSISQAVDTVTVETGHGNVYICKKVVLAVPPNQIGKLTLEPPLPTIKRELYKRMPMANYAFWREEGYSGESVTSGGPWTAGAGCICGPLCFTFDDTSANGDPALVTFVTGAQAVEWRQQTAEVRHKAILETLSQFFGSRVNEYVDCREKDWDEEPFCEGGPVCTAAPGAMKYYADCLRKPMGNIHLAGTETATVWAGYMSGAVQSGYRAAIEILANIRPGTVSQEDIDENDKPFKRSNSKLCKKPLTLMPIKPISPECRDTIYSVRCLVISHVTEIDHVIVGAN